MNFVKRKASTAKSKHAPEDFARLKKAFLDEVVAVVEMENIPPELILIWDQTWFQHLLGPCISWELDVLKYQG